jgi:hypothetical protein
LEYWWTQRYRTPIVITSPATESFKGGAILVALAWDVRVVAVGRVKGMLEELKKRFDGGRVEIVAIAWDVGG